MGKIIFVTGPVRSGKSRYALDMAKAWGDEVVYAATYRVRPDDLEMQERVRRHREERPDAWRTLEAPGDMVAALSHLDPPPSGVLLDCMTVWLAGRLEASDDGIMDGWNRLLAYFRRAPWPTVIVGNEVGWGLVPEEPELRRFRDLVGWITQITAREADEAWLCVAGCQVRLK
jgi:adenosyl cobinamide kinase/adenosyl cobinamide phosphate guanylyltransferase